jgi:hypothetical protein
MALPGWADTLIENSGAATGNFVVCPGGRIAFVFSGTTVSDVDIEMESIDGNGIPTLASLTSVAAKGLVVADLPPGRYRAVVAVGAAVDVRAARIPL